MGPIALFDKSFLQAISVDESVWFDKFFLPVVCPIFYIETLGNLAKDKTSLGPGETMVREIARKFPELGGSPCVFHTDVAVNDLLGLHTPLDGRVPRPGGRPVKKGVVYEATPEEIAFQRWGQGQFNEVERIAAACWRQAISELDLSVIAKELRALSVDGKSCKSLEQASDIARALVNGTDRVMERLGLAVHFLKVPDRLHGPIIRAWETEGRQPLNVFAPYAAHVVTVEVFFQVALAAGLIATERPSNRADIAYLYYLPFCMLFVSSDKLHRRTAPLFMRPNQEFVWGIDLKPALSAINAHFLQLPEAEREKGIMKFAGSPPPGNMVADLWDKHCRPHYRDDDKRERMSPEAEAALLSRFKEFRKQPTISASDAANMDDEMIAITRTVHRKRGSWYQVPKDMPDPPDDD